MNKKMFNSLVFCLIVLSLPLSTLKAQVTIGMGKVAERAALLSLKDTYSETSGDVSASKGGLLLPRVRLEKIDELLPFFSTEEISSSDYQNNQKLAHKGLYVYNLTDSPEADLSAGLYYWDGSKWNVVEQGIPGAIFTINTCAEDISVEGDYLDRVALSSDNYLLVKINVEKTGSYSIKAIGDPDNGYYFATEGTFYTTGEYEIIVPGIGKPKQYTPQSGLGDEVKIYLNHNENPVCKTYVRVNDARVRPNFMMVCSTVKVNGIYKKNLALDDSNTITLNINVATDAIGARYRIETDVVEGISFYAEGILEKAGPMTLTLKGSGTPLTTYSKVFTIASNSNLSPKSVCKATIVPVISQKKIMTAGDTTYGLTSGGNYGCGAMINDRMNYGDDPNSIVKYEGFSSVQVVNINSLNTNTLKTWTGDDGSEPYDIIVITYNITPNADQRKLLVDYVNKGGVLIYLDQNVSTLNAQLVADIFDEPLYKNPVSIGTTCNYLIKMNGSVDDEISNGPFGDVRFGQWGEDYANSCGLGWVPRGAIVYAGATNASTGAQSNSGAFVSILRHPTKNFFWCGDSGLIHGGNSNDNLTTPFKIGSRTFAGVIYPNYPVNKESYGSVTSANRLPVSNSTLFANVMAWAINQAETNGINSGK